MITIIENNINLNINEIMKIIQEKNKYIPPELFKYRKISDNTPIDENLHVDALKNQKVYLNHPYDFNDPYDSAFNIDIERFKEKNAEILEKKIKEEIVNHLLRQRGINPNIVNNKEIMYDDINIDKNMINTLLDNNSEVFYNAYFKKIIQFRVSCFSKTPYSILMWSHYANDHKGFCISYNTSKIKEKIKKELYPVFYQDILIPLIKTEKNLNTGKINSLLKYKDWKYEKEWRLILNEEFVSLKPSKIYLGVKFNENNLDYFKDIASKLKCKLYKMHINYSKYKLEETEIEI